MLRTITLAVNYLALAAALWLGLYVVTRSPGRLLAWLTGLTLWSVAGLFVNTLLALNPMPVSPGLPKWAQLLPPFWPTGAFEIGWGAWLQGRLVTPAIAFWHHATLVMQPGRMGRRRWAQVLLVYAVAVAAIVLQIRSPAVPDAASDDFLFLRAPTAVPWFPLFLVLLILITVMSLYNLVRAARAAPSAMPRKQLAILATATLAGGLVGPATLAALGLGLDVPVVLPSFTLGCVVGLIGVGVVRHGVIVEGRVLRRDFIYAVAAVALATAFYMGAMWALVLAYHLPAAIFVFVLMLAVVSHVLVDAAGRAIDRFFYLRQVRKLRAKLRLTTERVGTGQALQDFLLEALDSLCDSVRATFGLILLFEGDGLRLAAPGHLCRRAADRRPFHGQPGEGFSRAGHLE